MKRLRLALLIGGLGLVIGILHVLAINFFLYWDIFWFDMMMHFLGGMWVALLGFWILAFFNHTATFSLKNILIIAIIFTLAIGILWEVFEALAGVSFIGQDMWLDTLSDVFFDLLGGVISGIYIYRGYRKTTPSKSL